MLSMHLTHSPTGPPHGQTLLEKSGPPQFPDVSLTNLDSPWLALDHHWPAQHCATEVHLFSNPSLLDLQLPTSTWLLHKGSMTSGKLPSAVLSWHYLQELYKLHIRKFVLLNGLIILIWCRRFSWWSVISSNCQVDIKWILYSLLFVLISCVW